MPLPCRRRWPSLNLLVVLRTPAPLIRAALPATRTAGRYSVPHMHRAAAASDGSGADTEAPCPALLPQEAHSGAAHHPHRHGWLCCCESMVRCLHLAQNGAAITRPTTFSCEYNSFLFTSCRDRSQRPYPSDPARRCPFAWSWAVNRCGQSTSAWMQPRSLADQSSGACLQTRPQLDDMVSARPAACTATVQQRGHQFLHRPSLDPGLLVSCRLPARSPQLPGAEHELFHSHSHTAGQRPPGPGLVRDTRLVCKPPLQPCTDIAGWEQAC